jgi:hypothetical protein
MPQNAKPELLIKPVWAEDQRPLKNLAQAKKFMNAVGISLRYWETPGLPLASMYRAVAGKSGRKTRLPQAIDITNQLLESYEAIEVSVIAERLCLVHKSVMPALYKLVVRKPNPKLSLNAKMAVRLLEEKGHMSAGDVRKLLSVPSGQKIDPVYEALKELQNYLIVDRGPFKRPEKGIPYLSKEGYPYHFFHEAHFDLITESKDLSLEAAADIFISRFLAGARSCSLKKMTSLFKLFVNSDEIAQALHRLQSNEKIEVNKRGTDFIVTMS